MPKISLAIYPQLRLIYVGYIPRSLSRDQDHDCDSNHDHERHRQRTVSRTCSLPRTQVSKRNLPVHPCFQRSTRYPNIPLKDHIKMKSQLASIALLSNLFLAMANKSSFVGKWKIVEALDEEFQPFSLPDGDFYLELKDDDNGDNLLSASMKVGNVMRAMIAFGESTADGDSITIERVLSTRMMPPEHLFRLETFLSNSMPKMTTLKTETVGAMTQMTFSGLGQINFQKV
jgi:hypothetical protein